MELNLNVYEKPSLNKANACIIWMHGLGSDAQNMMGIAEAFPNNLGVSHVFIDAPIRPVTINNNMQMRAWYDIVGVKLTDREDKTGIMDSANNINEVINRQMAKGYQASQIFLAGFSQGGAMALYTGLINEQKLGGIISLSAYLPLVSELNNLNNKDVPIFLAMGEFDPVVLPAWTEASLNWLKQQEYTNLTLCKYPMEHNICIEEIRDLYNWLDSKISNKPVTEKIK